ncbi:MAG: TlpA disulfide reductase family protein [Thermoanaerobaculia bacterium]
MSDTPRSNSREIVWLIVGAALIAAVLAFSWSGLAKPGAARPAAAGATAEPSEPRESEANGPSRMPTVRLADLEGRAVESTAFAGKVVLYDFWATWCGPCHIESEILQAAYPKLKGLGVEFVSVATGEDRDTVAAFVAKKPVPYPLMLDPDEALSGKLEVMGLPTLVIVDKQGRITFRHTGLIDAGDLERELRAAGAA